MAILKSMSPTLLYSFHEPVVPATYEEKILKYYQTKTCMITYRTGLTLIVSTEKKQLRKTNQVTSLAIMD